MQQLGIFGTIAEQLTEDPKRTLIEKLMSDTTTMSDHQATQTQAMEETQVRTTTPGSRKHTLRFRQRAENPPPMNVTEREFAVAAALDKYRVLTVDQIEVLEFFSPTRSKASRCKSRLQKMFHNKIVAR